MEKINIAISVVNKSSEILSIIPPEVYFANCSDFPNPKISSIYRHKENISKNFINFLN
jgi:hypothetical protein